MKILDSTKSLSVLDVDTSNGLGQIQPLSCIVSEELNGIYECEFTVPTTDKHYSDLKTSGLIKVMVGDGSEQIFRIYSISEPINFVVEVKAQHITYDLSKIPVKPFTATGAVNVKNQMLANIIGSYDFTMSTDITNTTSTFKLGIPRSFRECLGGWEGSILDVFHPEYEWDNLEVKMLARRGADNNVRISYGKNLTDFRQEQNNENVYDAVYGYAVVDDVTYEASGIYNKTGAAKPKVLNVDFSSKYETGDVPTAAELLSYATSYATNNDIEVPKVNIEISFVPLWQSDEYKNFLPLERVSLGDTVHVYFDKLGVEASARVIKTEWNVLTQKYDSIELGSAKANLNTVINESVVSTIDNMDIEVDVGWLDDKIQIMSGLIANGLGLHITQDSLGRIILHNEENIASSQYQYMITSQGFMLSEDYGQTWSSGWDISGNAVLNSLSTITLRALEIYGSYIEGSQILFGDSQNKYIIAQVYNDGADDVGVSFDGSGYVRFQPQEKFTVNNLTANGDLLNEFVMSKSGSQSQPYVVLKNYDHLQNYNLANSFEMDASLNDTDGYYNYLKILNRQTASGTERDANYLSFSAYSGKNAFYLSNRKTGTTVVANQVEASSTTTSDYLYISNYFISQNVVANRLYLSTSSSGNTVSLYNNRTNASAYTDYGNHLWFYATSTQTTMALRNYKSDHNSYANEIFMLGRPINGSENSLDITNYDVDGSNKANELHMSKSSSTNSFYLRLYRGGTTVANIYLYRDTTNGLSVGLKIPTNSTYGYTYCELALKQDGSIYANGNHFYWNGSQKW